MASLEVDVFSMASSFIEDILGSEVDEKAVSAVVGSLESQLASPLSSTSSTVKTLPILQRPSQVSSASSSAASNASQSNNSVAATITNNTVPQAQAIMGKTLYHTNSTSGAVSIPINIAPRPAVTTAVSLAPRTVTLLSPRARGYIPVQSGGIGLPLTMCPLPGQLPLSSRMVPGAISLPRPAAPQNLISKMTSQVRNVQQSESAQRIAVAQIKHEPRLAQPTILNNNLHAQHPKTVQVAQNHSNLLAKKTGPVQGNVANHVLLSKTVTTAGGAIVTNTLGNVQGNMYKTKQVHQMIRVREQVMKLKGFFTKLTDLATDQSPEVGNVVQQLIQDVMVGDWAFAPCGSGFEGQMEQNVHHYFCEK